jgi:hypothetical protein
LKSLKKNLLFNEAVSLFTEIDYKRIGIHSYQATRLTMDVAYRDKLIRHRLTNQVRIAMLHFERHELRIC